MGSVRGSGVAWLAAVSSSKLVPTSPGLSKLTSAVRHGNVIA
jgi:hypothetical protein